MNKTSERVNRLIEEYMPKREKGMSNEEIAADYGLSVQTFYNHLQKIADENGVTREELLYRPNKSHVQSKPKAVWKKETVDPQELKNDFDRLLQQVSEIIQKVDQIEEQEENV